MRFFVVDDDSTVVEGIGKLLREEGHEVYAAVVSGTETEQKPGVDIVMHGSIGIDTLFEAVKAFDPDFALLDNSLGLDAFTGENIAEGARIPFEKRISISTDGRMPYCNGCIPCNKHLLGVYFSKIAAKDFREWVAGLQAA